MDIIELKEGEVLTNKEVLTETLENNILNPQPALVEGFLGADEKHYYIRGRFATIETVNNNKRFYPRALWEREVAKYQEEIKNGTINTLMEWDHPKDRLEVDPSQAIAKITKLWIDGNYVMGEAVVFDTPQADTIKSLIKYGVQVSVSSRASGRVDHSGVVQEFNLITFDMVAKPSDNAATMYGIFEKQDEELNMLDNSLMESLVNMVRTKEVEIQDLKEELAITKDRFEQEDEDYTFRRINHGTNNHRHQDVSAWEDTDPSGEQRSGEHDIKKIKRLLDRLDSRVESIGARLDKDVDSEDDDNVHGVSADVERRPRFYRAGRDDEHRIAESRGRRGRRLSERSNRPERSSRRSRLNESSRGRRSTPKGERAYERVVAIVESRERSRRSSRRSRLNEQSSRPTRSRRPNNRINRLFEGAAPSSCRGRDAKRRSILESLRSREERGFNRHQARKILDITMNEALMEAKVLPINQGPLTESEAAEFRKSHFTNVNDFRKDQAAKALAIKHIDVPTHLL